MRNISVIINRIKHRLLFENNSWQSMVIGPPGTGKSVSGMTFCKTIDPNFNINRVVLDVEPFLDLVNEDLPPGSAILCDEIGSWLSSRDWYSVQNKLMSIVLETYRFKRLAVIWTVPSIRMVDVNLRDLCHSIIETVNIDRKNNVCVCKYKYRQMNPLSGKAYDKFPVVRNAAGEHVTITRVRVHRPDKKLEDQYEKKKERHLNETYKDIRATLKRLRIAPGKRLKKKKRDLIRREFKRGKLTNSEIARKLSTTSAYVREVRRETMAEDL